MMTNVPWRILFFTHARCVVAFVTGCFSCSVKTGKHVIERTSLFKSISIYYKTLELNYFVFETFYLLPSLPSTDSSRL